MKQTTGVPLKGVDKGVISGEVLKWDGSISFLGDVDPENGTLTKDGSTWDIRDRVLLFREGAGSTVGSYVIYNLSLNGNSPLAMIMVKADAIITIGCILADIPLINRFDPGMMDSISTGDRIEIDTSGGSIKVY